MLELSLRAERGVTGWNITCSWFGTQRHRHVDNEAISQLHNIALEQSYDDEG